MYVCMYVYVYVYVCILTQTHTHILVHIYARTCMCSIVIIIRKATHTCKRIYIYIYIYISIPWCLTRHAYLCLCIHRATCIKNIQKRIIPAQNSHISTRWFLRVHVHLPCVNQYSAILSRISYHLTVHWQNTNTLKSSYFVIVSVRASSLCYTRRFWAGFYTVGHKYPYISALVSVCVQASASCYIQRCGVWFHTVLYWSGRTKIPYNNALVSVCAGIVIMLYSAILSRISYCFVLEWKDKIPYNNALVSVCAGIFLMLYSAILSKIHHGDSSSVGWIPIMIVCALHGFNGIYYAQVRHTNIHTYIHTYIYTQILIIVRCMVSTAFTMLRSGMHAHMYTYIRM
jgi:hypothetical protein